MENKRDNGPFKAPPGADFTVPCDVTETLPDGRQLLVASKGTVLTYEQACEMGMIKGYKPAIETKERKGGVFVGRAFESVDRR